jgi:hypothetical protein
MQSRKAWTKPTLEVARINAAQAGAYSTNDGQHTHKS